MNCALTIAGSDTGAGAGIQADLKTFAALKLHGLSVITSLTAQNPDKVLGVFPVQPAFVVKQLQAVINTFKPTAAKTGMLFSAEIIEAISTFLAKQKNLKLVVDPVMVSESGAQLLNPDAIDVLVKKLCPLAHLITPNIKEAEKLTNVKINSPETMRAAAKILFNMVQVPVLLKGGHLKKLAIAPDIFYDGKNELLYTAPRIKKVKTHGTGCTYSAAITAFLAKGLPLDSAILKAKTFVTTAIANSQSIKNYSVLGWF